MWKDSAKVIKVSCKDRVVELQGHRCLFSQFLVVCKSRSEVDLKTAIGQYEFSVVPRSLFVPDDTMPHCSSKSALMKISERLGDELQHGTNDTPQNGEGKETDVEP